MFEMPGQEYTVEISEPSLEGLAVVPGASTRPAERSCG